MESTGAHGHSDSDSGAQRPVDQPIRRDRLGATRGSGHGDDHKSSGLHRFMARGGDEMRGDQQRRGESDAASASGAHTSRWDHDTLFVMIISCQASDRDGPLGAAAAAAPVPVPASRSRARGRRRGAAAVDPSSPGRFCSIGADGLLEYDGERAANAAKDAAINQILLEAGAQPLGTPGTEPQPPRPAAPGYARKPVRGRNDFGFPTGWTRATTTDTCSNSQR